MNRSGTVRAPQRSWSFLGRRSWRFVAVSVVLAGVVVARPTVASACSCAWSEPEATLLSADLAVVAVPGSTRSTDGIAFVDATVVHVVFDRGDFAPEVGDVVRIELGGDDSCRGSVVPDRPVVLSRQGGAAGVFSGESCSSELRRVEPVAELADRLDGTAVTPPVAIVAFGGEVSLVDEAGVALRSATPRSDERVVQAWTCLDGVVLRWSDGTTTSTFGANPDGAENVVDVRCGLVRRSDGSWSSRFGSEPLVPAVEPERHDGGFWLDGADRLRTVDLEPIELPFAPLGLIAIGGVPVVLTAGPATVSMPTVGGAIAVDGAFWQVETVELPPGARLRPPIAGGASTAAVVVDGDRTWIVRSRASKVTIEPWLGPGHPVDVSSDLVAIAEVESEHVLVDRATGEVIGALGEFDHAALSPSHSVPERRDPVVLARFDVTGAEFADVGGPTTGPPVSRGQAALLALGAGAASILLLRSIRRRTDPITTTGG